jgi:hypothetical protein
MMKAMSVFQMLDKLLLALAAVMLLRAAFPFPALNTITSPLQAAVRFVTPLGFHERVISVIAALWCLGVKVAIPVGMMLRAWS